LGKLQYLDKRDNCGVLLRYSAHELAYDVSFKALNLISSNEIYSILINEIPQKYVDLYYQKMIYVTFLPLAHRLVIYKHDKLNYGKVSISAINANSFPCHELLKKIWPEKNINISFTFLRKVNSNAKERLKQFIKGQKRIRTILSSLKNTSSLNESLDLLKPKIAFNYVEGFDESKKTDLYWFEESGIDPDTIIVYYENPHMMIRFDDEQTGQSFFDTKGIRQVKLWEWDASNNKYPYNVVIKKLKSLKYSNDIEKWIKKTAINLCNKSSYWFCFFENHGIKIHMDPSESGLETIFKQIAINKIGGLSIGKCRSYPPNLDGAFVGYYPNDIFFTWGNDSADRIRTTNPHIENILSSGFPYISKPVDLSKETGCTGHEIKLRNTKFNLLLLDSNHSSNDGIIQFIPTTKMDSFFQIILGWVRQNEDVGVIIKLKKPHFLDNRTEIKNQISELEQSTTRVILIKDSFQKMPNSYLNGIDMVLGTSTFFPSAVIECVVHGTRAVFYDFPNLSHHEPELYQWGENKVIFPDLDDMVSAVKAYKNDPSSNPRLGDWSEHLDELDPFLDGHGGRRIGTYMHRLQEGFEEGLNRDDTIARANRLYAEAWGEDKVNS